jgi:tetratricopeptide (TPR) repeat protein
MQSYARSLTLTAALLLATVISLLIVSAQTKPETPRDPQPQALQGVTITRPPDNPRTDTTPPVPPITFADPDGQELILEELSVRTAIHGMLSLTELELRFRNPQERRIEGRFTCTLPANAAISRFAKDVNGHLMEGEVVERLRANQVYEQFLHQMRDPALLEQEQGNRFSARIFPIEPKAPVHLVLSYTSLLPMRGGVRTYALPLRGLSKVNKLTFRAFVTPIPGESTPGKLSSSTAEVTSFEETDWTPDRDIVLTWQAESGASAPQILRAGDFYLAAFRPPTTDNRQPTTRSWLFYLDTSASAAEGAPHRIRAIEEILSALPAQDRVQLVAFDQELVPLASGTASDLSTRVGDLLRTRLFLGGTDLSAVLRDVAGKLRQDPARAVVLASDLTATVGSTAPHDIKTAIDALPRGTVHALILGSREDAPTAKAITAGRGRVVRLPFTESLASRAREAADHLRRPTGGSFDVADAAAEWIYPARFEDVHAGDEVLALGKVKAGREPQIAGARVVSLDSSTFAPLLEREAYRAYLEYLAEREAADPSEAVRRALATEQVKISVEQRVVIPRTTMLVLESEWDYQRFGLDRRALAAILTIDAGGIGRIDRQRSEWTPPPPRPMPVTVPRGRRDAAKSQAPPPAVAAPAPAEDTALDRILSLRVESEEEGVEGEVAGGVTGGVVGGVPGGTVSARTADSVAISEAPRQPAMLPRGVAVTVPPEPPPAPPPPPALRREQKRPDADWISRNRPSQATIAALEAKLEENPRDRETYNQLSEILAGRSEWNDLRRLALRWQPYDPENPQVYEVLGLADVELGKESEAARAFASLIEVAPGKPELLQRAGLLLLRTRRASIAETPLRRALEIRPDRANAYRHLALMLWQEGRVEEAARVLESATRQTFPNWYGDVQRVIREELGYVYRAWLQMDPSQRRDIEARAREYRVDLERDDALRITLVWETDANDVDLHVIEPSGDEVYYSNPRSSSGLELYGDITQGLGPEVIRTSRPQRGTYHVGVRYFSAGPMGISRGVVAVMKDGKVEIHPFRLAQGGAPIRYVTGVKME